jgi:hypothetical protein
VSESANRLLLGHMQHRTARGASSDASDAITRIALPAVHLPAVEAHPEIAEIVLVPKADRARVLQGSARPTRAGTRGRITACATATRFPAHLLVPSTFPMGCLTLHAAVPHALAPPATLHRANRISLLAVGTHQPTPYWYPTFLAHLALP